MSYHIFDLRCIDTGRLIAQCMSRQSCLREAKWHDITNWSVEEFLRDGSDRFGSGYCRPTRFVRPWPIAKIEEFRLRYLAGTPLRELEDHFDAPTSSLLKRARQLQIPRRFDWPERWERHGGKWTAREDELIRLLYCDERVPIDKIMRHVDRTYDAIYHRLMYKAFVGEWSVEEDELINFLHDEGMTIDEIAQHLKRLPGAITERLGKTARSLSTRSRSGRFIKEGRGRPIHRVLEEARRTTRKVEDSGPQGIQVSRQDWNAV